MTAPPIPIGVDDFREVREAGLDYVDKSDLLRQIIDRAGVKVFLFPRPRRFGKTLNLSMIRCWFEKQDTDFTHLFEGLSISLAHADGTFQRLLGRLAKVDVLMLDDWGLAPLRDAERRDLQEILEDRHGSRSTIVTSQIPVEKWHASAASRSS